MPIYQCWDEDLFRSYSADPSVMTNASDANWSLQFVPQSIYDTLVASSQQGTVCKGIFTKGGPSAVLRDVHNALQGEVVGVISGNSPQTGDVFAQLVRHHFSQKIRSLRVFNAKIQSRELDDPQRTAEIAVRLEADRSQLTIDRIDVPYAALSMDMWLHGDEVLEKDLESIGSKIRSGATVIAIPCHTRQWFRRQFAELCTDNSVVFADITDAVRRRLLRVANLEESSGRMRVLVLGGRYIYPGSGYNAYNQMYSDTELNQCVEFVFPSPADQSTLHSLMERIKGGKDSGPKSHIYSLLEQYRDTNIFDKILLLGTEFSELGLERRGGRRRKRKGNTSDLETPKVIDGLDAYAEYVVDLVFEKVMKMGQRGDGEQL